MRLLFVCLGNTCRSPMAESVMARCIRDRCLSWQVDSAGLIALNVGRMPEERCLRVLAENGLSSQHVGRQITLEDFKAFDYIFGMDTTNIQELQKLAAQVDAGACTARLAEIELLGSYIGRPEDEIINDPYFTEGIGAFRAVYAQINESCSNFVEMHKNDK